MKGIDIVVQGSVGHMSAFMAQAGSLIVFGDAGDFLGDSIDEARLFVRGRVKSLGADCIEKPMREEHKRALHETLGRAGFNGEIDPSEFKRYGSARKLYNFHVDNAGAYSWIGRPEPLRALRPRSMNIRCRRSAARRPRNYDIRGAGTKRRLPHFDDLLFLGASISRYPLEGYREKCGTDIWLGTRFAQQPIHIKIPMTIAGMSFGSLSAQAKEALAAAPPRSVPRPPPATAA